MATLHKRIAYRNLEHSPQIERFINERLVKVEELLSSERTPKSIDFVLTKEHIGVIYEAQFHVVTPDFNLYTKREGKDLYSIIDDTIETMLQDIRKAKEKHSEAQKDTDYFKSA